jgi:hypothetical protein
MGELDNNLFRRRRHRLDFFLKALIYIANGFWQEIIIIFIILFLYGNLYLIWS